MRYPKERKKRTGDVGPIKERKEYYNSCSKCKYCCYELANVSGKDSWKHGLKRALKDKVELLKHYNNNHPDKANEIWPLFKNDELVTCPICKLKMRQITDRHLLKHNITTTKEFLEKYPNTPMRPKSLKKKWSVHAKKLNSTSENGEKISESLQEAHKSGKHDELMKRLSKEKKEKYASGELVPWNKGLTKDDHPSIMSTSDKFRKLWSNNRMSSGAKVKGYFHSKKNDYEIPYRSSYELRAFEILEKDNKVEWYKYEKIKIKYRGKDNKIHSYYPDIITSDGRIIEVKSDWIFEALDSSNDVFRKFRAAERYAEKHGHTFEVWIEKDLGL